MNWWADAAVVGHGRAHRFVLRRAHLSHSCFVCGIVLLIAGGVAGSMFLVELGVLGLCCAVPIFLTALLPWCCHGCSPSCCHDSCPATERQRNQHAVACMVGIVLLLIAGTVAYEVH